MLFAIAACSVLFAPTLLAGQTPPSDALTANPVFEKNCAKCHGKTAEGRFFAGPSLRSEKVAAASTEDLRNIITNGKSRMPKYGTKLSAGNIDKIVEQIKTSAKK